MLPPNTVAFFGVTKAELVELLAVMVVTLTLLHSTIGASSLKFNSMLTAYAGTSGESVHEAILNLSTNKGDSFGSVIAASGGNSYVAWIDYTPGHNAVFLAKSIDGGTSFRNATVLSDNTTIPEGLQIAASSIIRSVLNCITKV